MLVNDPYQRAKNIYDQHGGDFPGDLGWMLRYGVVVNTPETFLMGYFFQKSDTKHPVPANQSDGVFVVLCVGEPKSALYKLVNMVSLLAYERSFRGDDRIRILDIKKYYHKL